MSDELRERVAALLNANCFDGCEPGADEMRACVYPPCRCRTVADAAIALVLEEAARVADRYEIPMCETSASHIAAHLRKMKDKP